MFSVKSDKKLSPSVVRDLNGTLEREGAVMGFIITLYPLPNIVKEAKKYGTYKSNMNDLTFQKIQVIHVERILNGERLNLPVATEVLKKSEKVSKKNQGELDF